MDHETLVGFAKTFGLLYLVVMFLLCVAHALLPSRQEEIDRAARSVLHDEEGPCP
jgi:cytochrome c oxidase cbb3-type subunit 4